VGSLVDPFAVLRYIDRAALLSAAFAAADVRILPTRRRQPSGGQ
jgi:hypothetical protein